MLSLKSNWYIIDTLAFARTITGWTYTAFADALRSGNSSEEPAMGPDEVVIKVKRIGRVAQPFVPE